MLVPFLIVVAKDSTKPASGRVCLSSQVGGAIYRGGGGEMAGPRQGSRSGSGPLARASNEETVRDEQGWSHLLLFF